MSWDFEIDFLRGGFVRGVVVDSDGRIDAGVVDEYFCEVWKDMLLNIVVSWVRLQVTCEKLHLLLG
jgi:hypothetical protein